MMNYLSRFSHVRYFPFFALALLMVICFSSSRAYAGGCSFQGVNSSIVADDPFELRSLAFQMLEKKRWFDDRRYPVGSLMGVATALASGGNCRLIDLLGHRVSVVYEPPAGTELGPGRYRIPTDHAGVSVDLEIQGTPYVAGGIKILESVGEVRAGGNLSASNARWGNFSIKISLVKTASFGGEKGDGNINFSKGLGTMRFYSLSQPYLSSASTTPVGMPSMINGPLDDRRGLALPPACELTSLGSISFTNPTGNSSIKLSAVSQNDFGTSVGAIDKSANSQKVYFACTGTDDTKPTIYFDTTYPFNGGNSGVGFAIDTGTGKVRSDVGIQVLLNDVPVKFHQASDVLGWTRKLYGPIPGFPGISEQGLYCASNCGDSMTGPNWVEGGASFGSNADFDSQVTFKYYQTTSAKPAAGTFSVPFTITMELQ